MNSTHVLFETTKYELQTPPADGCTRNRYFQLIDKSFYMNDNRLQALQWVVIISVQNINFWCTHLQVEFEAHIWWFRRAHEYSSSTKYEGLTPNRKRFIDDPIFWLTMGFSYNRPDLASDLRFWSSNEP